MKQSQIVNGTRMEDNVENNEDSSKESLSHHIMENLTASSITQGEYEVGGAVSFRRTDPNPQQDNNGDLIVTWGEKKYKVKIEEVIE